MVKVLYGQMHSDNVNQCVFDQCFAISILERVARAHADGIYRWRKSAWGKLDGMAALTRDMKYEWMRCMGCVAGFFFSIASTGVERKLGPVLAALKKSRGDSSMDGVCVLDWRSGKRSAAVEEKG